MGFDEDNLDPAGQKIGAFGFVKSHYGGLQLWRKLLLTLSLTAAVIGAVGMGVGTATKTATTNPAPAVAPEPAAPPRPTVAGDAPANASSPDASPNARGFLSPQQIEQVKQKTRAAEQAAVEKARWFYDQFSPNLWQIGISFFVAFILGYGFRQFIRTMATLVAIAVMAALVIQLAGWADVVGMLRGSAEETRALGDQIYALAKTIVTERLPATTTGVVGFAVGFLKKR